jgi:soluble cytochrome b562
MPDAAELMTLLEQSRTDLAAANQAIEEQREKDAENEKIIRDLRTELEDKIRQIDDLEFVRRKECAELERDKQKVIQELELQKALRRNWNAR